MNKLSPSFFARLYGYIFIAMVASIALTFVIIERWNQDTSSEDFVEDTLFVKTILEQQRQAQNGSAPKTSAKDFYRRIDSQLLPFEISWLDSTNIRHHFAHSEYIDEYKNVSVYGLNDGRLLSSHTLSGAIGRLIIQDKPEPSPVTSEPNPFDALDLEEYTIVIFCIFTILSSGLALYVPLRNLQKHINHLDNISERIGEGDFTIQASDNLPAPINKLSARLNHMAEALSNKFNESQIFAQAVPHELRTPLTRIQLAAGVLRQTSPTGEQLDLIDNIDQYIGDLDELCSQIITLSRLNITVDEIPKNTINISEFIHSRLHQLALTSSPTITINCDNQKVITTNEVNLRLILDNLLKNAALHANKQVTISVEASSPLLILVIEDDGEGIPEAEKENIFLPFARLDKSRNRKTGGLGLGLAIVKAATNSLQGTITVTNSPVNGARFILRIPNS